MSLDLALPPFHRGHRRTVSVRTLDTDLENSFSPTKSSRPSTASTQSPFRTAYGTLASEPRFRHYLPHISTEDKGAYTRNDNYACNLSPITPFQSLPPVHFGRFYRYIPDLSGEEDDVYTDGVNIMHDTLHGPGQLHVQPEQKVVGDFREVNYLEKKGIKSHKEKHKRTVSLAEMSERVKEMLRKMHIGKKVEDHYLKQFRAGRKMPSFFNDLKSRAEALYHYDDKDEITKYRRDEKTHKTRALPCSAAHAAMRGLYAAPKQRHGAARPTQIEQLDRVREEDDDPNDPIIWHSMYPQMNGKRRSELEADVVKYAGCVASILLVLSDYGSDSNPKGREVRVCIYPQAKYTKVPVKTPLKTPFGFNQVLSGSTDSATAKPPTPIVPSYRDWKRDMLPHTEFQTLRRRQAMECAREVLEPLYRRCHRHLYPNIKQKKGLVGHGETQWFAEPYHGVRLQNSKIQYCVRKARQAGLDQYSQEFDHAMTKRAQNERFCEMSDVDGTPVEETLLIDFLKALRKFQNKAIVPEDPKLAMVWPGEFAQRISVDGREDLYRVDRGATTHACAQQPVPVSQFDWNSSDNESEIPKRLTKTKRTSNSNVYGSDKNIRIGGHSTPIMMSTHGSKRSSRNPYRDYDDKLPPTNPFLDDKVEEDKETRTSHDQTQLSPMFVDHLRAKTGAPIDLEKINTDTKISDKYKRYTLSPIDGKTEGCNRTHTFDTFVDARKVSGDAGQTKKVGHGWQVARALKRVMSTKGRGSRKTRYDEALPVRLAA
ncbi:hypothetical protein E8E12_008045 [Didymella heteroderae]|uniref:Uncharacterized protein n=1 Tax=Didymella heteroderae TaxID=1769908 RepID=A0A9P5C6Z0_9PLEO|nr:hypothetical protein E8E12_008045 [Didymella heteroderae]